MKDQFFETGAHAEGQTEEGGMYAKYRELGGIINEGDCISAMERAEKTTAVGGAAIAQAEAIAKHAGIILDNSSGVDQKVKLYAVLRADNKPEGVKDHHSQMSDQRLFAEAARMAGDADALNKLVAAYPRMSF